MRILTSLAEDHYFQGLSALVHSALHHGAGFFDAFVVGYRGALPDWWPPTRQGELGEVLELGGGVELITVRMDEERHMVHEKPRWLRRVCRELFPDADEFFFFDSDIVLNQRLSFYSEWIAQGVALCEDVLADMAADHPIRRQWAAFAEAEGLTVQRSLHRYFNSGFLGWRREDSTFIDDWIRCLEILAPHSGDLKQFRTQDRSHPVLSANQDSLNIAAMISKRRISTMGREAMSFDYGLRLMFHPLGKRRKPWKREYLLRFFAGKPPSALDLAYWRFARGPVFQPFSPFTIRRKLATCRILAFLSRFYSRRRRED